MTKRILIFSVLVVFGILIFEGCKKDESTVNPKKTTLREKIIGKWNFNREYELDYNVRIDTIGDTISKNIVEFDSLYSNSFVYFYSDSTYLLDRHSGTTFIGTWYPLPDEFDDEHLILVKYVCGIWGCSSNQPVYHILTLTSDNLILKFSSESNYTSSWNGTTYFYKDVHILEMSK